MILEIDDSKTTGDLQERFSIHFPLLKLQFCRRKHGWEEVCNGSGIVHQDLPISEVRGKHNSGTIELNVWQKIGKIESEFYERFGLSFQICYKSGKYWIQTGKSDNMTIDSLMRNASEELNEILL